ncbi:unnamed protein product [Bemisia tabaci]|uniref:DNA excision repair protein ERCC-1 n=1 Tax=Bemisia tabaci TaxID=7038 RepID=A0A9P0EZ99_BEMTA|nr:unnamed protein product [Bemisia tabaci]
MASEFSAAFKKLKESDSYRKTIAENEKSGGSTSSEAPKSGSSSGSSGHAVLVNPKQRGNPILKSICNVPWEFNDGIIPDYVMGKTSCALFLSLRYHNLKPDYINERIKQLGKLYELRVLLVQVDMKDPHHALKHLTRVCLLTDLTLMLAWTPEEAGKIIETYKIFEHKPPDLIMEKAETDPHIKITSALTTVRSVNKSDAATLLDTFGSLSGIIRASQDALSLCPGFGPQKAARLHKALRQPFLKADNVNRKQTGILKYLGSSQQSSSS